MEEVLEIKYVRECMQGLMEISADIDANAVVEKLGLTENIFKAI